MSLKQTDVTGFRFLCIPMVFVSGRVEGLAVGVIVSFQSPEKTGKPEYRLNKLIS